MSELSHDTPAILALYLQLAQYPILAQSIRSRMRDELFRRGVITPHHLEQEAKDKAVQSQLREGLADPFGEEEASIWQGRLNHVRDHLTDFYFAYNLPLTLFEQIVEELVAERRTRHGDATSPREVRLTFNPELAPVDLLLRQARHYEALPADQRASIFHHLEEIIVVLIRTMISDHLDFVRVAKGRFTAADFDFIRSRRLGGGKIGGKAAGMLLAWKVLQASAPDVAERVTVPGSYFVGADVFYDIKAINRLEHNQKYKPADQIRAEYPQIQATYEQAAFPPEIVDGFRRILDEVGRTPIIVRSSSLLEDSFGKSFAGKYDSYFCPNQGTHQQNLEALMTAVRRIYASVYSPDVLIYRRRMGLLDYNERMAILIQEVQGEVYHHYFFPSVSGVAFSQSPFAWTPRLRREDGFVRMVLGLGTRAIDRVGEDYPRLVFLSHPLLRPERTPRDVAHYSQHFIDALDLRSNRFATLPVRQVLQHDFPALRWVASLQDSDTLLPVKRLGPHLKPEQLVLTFDSLLGRSDFVELMKQVLTTLARHYGLPVDVEFTIGLSADLDRPRLTFNILQCRPQSLGARAEPVGALPTAVAEADVLFSTGRLVPEGQVNGIEYVVYVPAAAYQQLEARQRKAVAHQIGQINKALEGRAFILIGPGRWGSSNIQLGVPVTYADIYNVRALVEVAAGPDAPEPSFGTHFFQDLLESNIYPLSVQPNEPGESLNTTLLEGSANQLYTLIAAEGEDLSACLKVVGVAAARPGQRLDLLMDGERALAYFAPVG